MTAFSWVLLAFPIYLFTKGRFVAYVELAGAK